MSMTACQFCGHPNRSAASTCSHCGAPMSREAPGQWAGRRVARSAAGSVGPPMQQHGVPQPGMTYGMQSAGGPPNKSKTGLIVGIGLGGVGALAFVAFLVTGFLTPGFLINDANSSAESAPNSAAPTPSSPPTPTGLTRDGLPPSAPTKKGWPTSANDSIGPARTVTDEIRAGDKTQLLRQLCKDSDFKEYLVEDVDQLIKAHADLHVGSADPRLIKGKTLVTVTGTYKGEKIGKGSSIGLVSKNYGDTWCIDEFEIM